ncbi:transmembrane 7 superfamily member 3-like [Ptychodera flava]|uniref:transmembrane 7 superfamily member 3-like n=1 Tax=Ptychodera flava TaxID=63121 RepID=UPI00396AAEEE
MTRLYFKVTFIVCLAQVLAGTTNDVVMMKAGQTMEVKLAANSNYQFILGNITDGRDIVAVFQIHTQYQNISASLTALPTTDTAMNASDIGLITELDYLQIVAFWLVNSTHNNTVSAQATALLYKDNDPIPGACNFEFNLINDANIHLHYNIYETFIQFQPANIGWTRRAAQSTCDSSLSPRLRLVYEIYLYFLPEHNLEESRLFHGLQKMTTVDEIEKHGTSIATLDSHSLTSFTVSSFHGQGVIYNVIVRDPYEGTSAAYIPASSYACNFTDKVDGCHSSNSPTSLVAVTIFGVLGLFICFAGHRYFKTELFVFGFLITALVFFIIFGAATELTYLVHLIVSGVFGLVGGTLLVLYWWRFGSVVWCVVFVGFLLGYLIAATLFFTPFGDLKPWQNNVDYGLCFACFVLLVPVLLIYFTKQLNIIACAVIGSYLCVIAISSYLYTSLAYIVLNPLKRILLEDYDQAYTQVPFQRNDYILVGVWIAMTLSGLVVQFYRERGRGFPPCPYKEFKRKRNEPSVEKEILDRHLQQNSFGEDDERRPLLQTA